MPTTGCGRAIYYGLMDVSESLLIADLRASYRSGKTTPSALLERLIEAASVADERHVWITRLSREQIAAYVAALDPSRFDDLPLYGVPFVVKDNIDLAGVATTAGCPAFAYTPKHSAFAVQRLIEAGAVPLGKTNLDQFATGLVGTRSPYGACRNAIDPQFISGGSSSGSAVAVARGLASFSLGTDTAGSGRVPAAFNNIVGLKPSNGRLSTSGVVPACRSLDCLSIFALTAPDAAAVLEVAQGYDAADPYSRDIVDVPLRRTVVDTGGSAVLGGLRVGVPRADQLQFFGDAEYERLFADTVGRLESLGACPQTIDFAPFLDAARLLYEGPWIAERYAAVGSFIEANPGAVHPLTRQIIEAGKRPSAAAAFAAAYRLRALERQSAVAWREVDVLLTPTAGTIYRLRELESDPLGRNANLGYYTNFMNLFELAGIAVPAGFRADGLPFGVTLVGPGGSDRALLAIAEHLHRASVTTLGALEQRLPDALPAPCPPHVRDGFVALAVCGAHMQGLPLNHQLQGRGGYLLQSTRTAPLYRLYALPGGPPFRPGLVRVSDAGSPIALEVWALPTLHVGSFVAAIPAPLGIGKIELESGELVSGFICEGYAADRATDITSYGGWREYVKAAFV